MLAENYQQHCKILNPYAFFFFTLACERISTKMHSIKKVALLH